MRREVKLLHGLRLSFFKVFVKRNSQFILLSCTLRTNSTCLQRDTLGCGIRNLDFDFHDEVGFYDRKVDPVWPGDNHPSFVLLILEYRLLDLAHSLLLRVVVHVYVILRRQNVFSTRRASFGVFLGVGKSTSTGRRLLGVILGSIHDR